MLQKEFLRSNVKAREFDSFEFGTKQLVKAVLGDALTGTDEHIICLGENLRRSDLVIGAAQNLLQEKPLVIGWPDWLYVVSEECLKPYHEESFMHLQRVKRILLKVRDLLEKYGPFNIPDFGHKEYLKVRDQLNLTEDDWLLLEYASWIHDLCRMAYPVSFWETPGKFSPAQVRDLEAHARLFYYLGEFFNVDRRVVGLSVLHHHPNKHYPHNGIVRKLADLTADEKFMVQLRLLINLDIYEGTTGIRGYRREPWPHEKAIETMPGELGEVGTGYLPLIHALWEQTPGAMICPHN